MIFNDRRANARALKAAQGPSLATSNKKWESTHNSIERAKVDREAKWGSSASAGSRKESYSRAAKYIENGPRMNKKASK